MACSCNKNKQRTAKVTKVNRTTRSLSDGGRIRRAEKRLIR